MAWPKLAKLLDGVRLRARARLIRRAGLFDDAFYLAQCGGDPEARRDPLRHYLARGAAAGLDPNPGFDTSYYVARHPWVARYPKGPLVHYLRYGAREGLNPSATFDTAYYLEACPEARASGQNPLAHFLRHGRAAGVPPSPWDPAARERAARGGAADDEALRAAEARLVGAPGLSLEPRDRVLVVDARMLRPDQDSGSVRMLGILRLLAGLGHEITFVSDALERLPEYEERLRPFAPCVLYGLEAARAHLEAEGGTYRHAILSRAEPAHRFLATVRAFAPNARVAFDTVDLHAVRMRRGAEVTGDPALRIEADRLRALERAVAESSDLVVAITEEERAVLAAEAPRARVAVVPNVHTVRASAPGPIGRSGLVFIGGFEHLPNVDAVLWFVREILPLVHRSLPDVGFTVIGSKPTEDVLRLRSRLVDVAGFVPDVEPLFDRGRVFVAPLRYGAGMKGKIGQAMALGLPVVTTSIGAEGMGLVDGDTALLADAPSAFAEAIVRLHRDEELWTRLSVRGRAHVEQRFSERPVGALLATLFSAAAAPAPGAAAEAGPRAEARP